MHYILTFIVIACVLVSYILFFHRQINILVERKEHIPSSGRHTDPSCWADTRVCNRKWMNISHAGGRHYRIDFYTYRKVNPGMQVTLRQWGETWRLQGRPRNP